MSETVSFDQRIAAIRRFSRFYTAVIGALQEGLLDSGFSLVEARVLYELANRAATAASLCRELGIDPGYLSRIVARFTAQGLVDRTPVASDQRQYLLTLTEAGMAAFAPLDARSRNQVGSMLGSLPEPAQSEVVAAMQRIETLLGQGRSAQPWRLRDPSPGDIGWVIARHGALYAEEYNFDSRFEALVANVAGAFLANHDPARERCWIAEQDGVRLGSIFLMRASDEEAKLRLLLVEPAARGLGIGKRLVSECIAFARAAGYRRMVLWTNDILTAARAIYRAEGFRLVNSKPHTMFGPAMVGEDWEKTL